MKSMFTSVIRVVPVIAIKVILHTLQSKCCSPNTVCKSPDRRTDVATITFVPIQIRKSENDIFKDAVLIGNGNGHQRSPEVCYLDVSSDRILQSLKRYRLTIRCSPRFSFCLYSCRLHVLHDVTSFASPLIFTLPF